MADEKVFKKPIWDETKRAWDLTDSVAGTMYEWLSEHVRGPYDVQSSMKGFQLVGTLDPGNPSIDNLPTPPDWMTPEIQMQAACVWNAGAVQGFLVENGFIPVIRGIIDDSGTEFEHYRGGIASDSITLPGGNGGVRAIKIDPQLGDYVLTDASTIIIQPLGAGTVSSVLRTTDGWSWNCAGRTSIHIFA